MLLRLTEVVKHHKTKASFHTQPWKILFPSVWLVAVTASISDGEGTVREIMSFIWTWKSGIEKWIGTPPKAGYLTQKVGGTSSAWQHGMKKCSIMRNKLFYSSWWSSACITAASPWSILQYDIMTCSLFDFQVKTLICCSLRWIFVEMHPGSCSLSTGILADSCLISLLFALCSSLWWEVRGLGWAGIIQIWSILADFLVIQVICSSLSDELSDGSRKLVKRRQQEEEEGGWVTMNTHHVSWCSSRWTVGDTHSLYEYSIKTHTDHLKGCLVQRRRSEAAATTMRSLFWLLVTM